MRPLNRSSRREEARIFDHEKNEPPDVGCYDVPAEPAFVNHSFPTLDEAIATLQPLFRPETIHRPGYELGIRCPIVVLRPT
jgi:hypothetical protein